MMYKWLEAPEHTVETFNKAFNLSQLVGFKPNQPVELGEIQVGGLRVVKVANKTLLIELRSSNMSILLDEDEDEAEFIIKLNKNESKVAKYLEKKGDSTYNEIKTKLKMTRNVMSKAVTALIGKQVIISNNQGSKHHKMNKMLTLIKIPDEDFVYE